MLAADPGTGVVRVRLAPAEELTVALSSFLKDEYLYHFALQRWRAADAPVQVVKDGRHPMATPVRTLTLVHAVRRLLTEPAGSLTPVTRSAGDAATVLTPAPGLLGVDAASTLQLQLTAAWTEVQDDVSREVSGMAVQLIGIARDDQEFRQAVDHEHGDTRHRLIRYTATAISRFRDLFDPAEDAERLVTRTTFDAVSIPSTSRPAPPAIRAVVPAFRWTTEHGLRKDGRRIADDLDLDHQGCGAQADPEQRLPAGLAAAALSAPGRLGATGARRCPRPPSPRSVVLRRQHHLVSERRGGSTEHLLDVGSGHGCVEEGACVGVPRVRAGPGSVHQLADSIGTRVMSVVSDLDEGRIARRADASDALLVRQPGCRFR